MTGFFQWFPKFLRLIAEMSFWLPKSVLMISKVHEFLISKFVRLISEMNFWFPKFAQLISFWNEFLMSKICPFDFLSNFFDFQNFSIWFPKFFRLISQMGFWFSKIYWFVFQLRLRFPTFFRFISEMGWSIQPCDLEFQLSVHHGYSLVKELLKTVHRFSIRFGQLV